MSTVDVDDAMRRRDAAAAANGKIEAAEAVAIPMVPIQPTSLTRFGSAKGRTFSKSEGYFTLTFENVNVHVEKKPVFGTALRKQILFNVTGYAASGQVVAIIGPSGAGKTTLLDVLATRWLLQDNSVKLNGQRLTPDLFKSYCSYMPQDDRLWANLTVRENLHYASKLFMDSSFSQAHRDERVEAVIAELGLESCADTVVGNVFVKGVSGGQKRRCSIGVALMSGASCLFLDEPTSGLDAASAAEIMALLTYLAREKNLLVVASIHQPASRIFLNFDRVMLLSRGRVAFFGTAERSLTYFAELGYPVPNLMNPADHLLDLVNSDFVEKEQVEAIVSAWSKSEDAQSLARTVSAEHNKGISLSRRWRGPNGLVKTGILIQRTAHNYSKDQIAYLSRFFNYLFMSIFLGTLYVNLERIQEDILDRVFLIQWVIAFNSYMAMSALGVFAIERAVVTTEIANGTYSAFHYVFANAVVQAPLVFVMTLAAATPAYWIPNLNSSGSSFGLYVVLFFAFLYVIESIAVLVGTLVADFVIGLVLGNSLLSVLFVFNRFFIQEESAPWVWRWIVYISPYRYVSDAQLNIVFSGETFSGFNECLQQQANGSSVTCYGESGDEVLEAVRSGLADVEPGEWLAVLFATAVVLRFFIWFALWSRRN